MKIKCKICGKESNNQNALNEHIRKSQDLEHNRYLFPDSLVKNIDYIECKICGRRGRQLINHILRYHSEISIEEYKKKFNCEIMCEDKIPKGEKNGMFGKEIPESTKEKWRESRKGNGNGMFGKHHKEESKKNMGVWKDKVLTEEHKNNIGIGVKKADYHPTEEFKQYLSKRFKGVPKTEECKRKISNKLTGTKQTEEAKANVRKANKERGYSHGLIGKRKDINDGNNYRSTSEANYARMLYYEKIKFVFEMEFQLSNGSWYVPDFYLVDKDEYVEVKGYERNGVFPNKEKFEMFKIDYPDKKINIIFCTSNEWKELESKYSSLLPLWETKRHNIRTHPEIYRSI